MFRDRYVSVFPDCIYGVNGTHCARRDYVVTYVIVRLAASRIRNEGCFFFGVPFPVLA
jgi:hypothetical protein